MAPCDPERERDILEGIQVQGWKGTPATVAPLDGCIDEDRQPLQILRTDDHVDCLRPLQDRVTFLLRDASRHRHDRALTCPETGVMELPEPGEELLFRLLPDAAGVDDDDIGVAFVPGRLVARLLEKPRHPLGVMKVHLATECFDQVFARHFRFRLLV